MVCRRVWPIVAPRTRAISPSNYLEGAFYGLTVLGCVKMAMRLIEPLRGAMIGSGHNIAGSRPSSLASALSSFV